MQLQRNEVLTGITRRRYPRGPDRDPGAVGGAGTFPSANDLQDIF